MSKCRPSLRCRLRGRARGNQCMPWNLQSEVHRGEDQEWGDMRGWLEIFESKLCFQNKQRNTGHYQDSDGMWGSSIKPIRINEKQIRINEDFKIPPPWFPCWGFLLHVLIKERGFTAFDTEVNSNTDHAKRKMKYTLLCPFRGTSKYGCHQLYFLSVVCPF